MNTRDRDRLLIGTGWITAGPYLEVAKNVVFREASKWESFPQSSGSCEKLSGNFCLDFGIRKK